MKCDRKSDDTGASDSVIRYAICDDGPPAAPVQLLPIQLPSGKWRFAADPRDIPAAIYDTQQLQPQRHRLQ
jgi:hypothetical protein